MARSENLVEPIFLGTSRSDFNASFREVRAPATFAVLLESKATFLALGGADRGVPVAGFDRASDSFEEESKNLKHPALDAPEAPIGGGKEPLLRSFSGCDALGFSLASSFFAIGSLELLLRPDLGAAFMASSRPISDNRSVGKIESF